MAEPGTDPRNQHDLEQLRLPEPAAGLWKRIRETVHQLGSRRPEKRIEPHIGGGTTLAARWGHRASTDIDITLPGDSGLADLTRDDEHNLARRIGGEAKIDNIDEIKIRCTDGMLHLARLRPSAQGAEKHTIADGKVETVLSNSQILRGKLNRGMTSPVRDVFDVVCAAKADPRALATAVSMLEGTTAERIATNWKLQNNTFERAAKKELRNVPPEFETDLSRLGSNAAEALETHRYQRLQIEVDERDMVITKTVDGGPLEPERYPANDVRNALRTSGMEEHLEANGPVMPVMIAIAIDTMIKYGRSGILYDSNDRETHDQVAFPDKHFDPDWKPLAQVLSDRQKARNRTASRDENDSKDDPRAETRGVMAAHADKMTTGPKAEGTNRPSIPNARGPAKTPAKGHEH